MYEEVGCPRLRPLAPSGWEPPPLSVTSLVEQGRALEPGKASGRESKLGESGMKLLEEDLHQRPAVTYENRAQLLHRLVGVEVSKATICWVVKRMDYTRKKEQWVLHKEMGGTEQLGG